MSVRQTKINWAGATWNPVSGCSQVSEGCQNCYAMKMAGRMIKGKYAGLVRQRGKGLGATWTGGIRLEADALNTPLTWRQPTKIFVNSMSDLFHEDVPDAWIDQIVGVMQATPQHIYQILTKRADRLPLYTPPGGTWPTNVWLGVSIESDKHLDRIDHLRKTDAAVKWVSAEPLIAPLLGLDVTGIDWMVIGGESGAGHRKMELAWVREIMTACKAGGVPVWVKQLGTSLGFELTGSRNKCNFEEYNHVWPEDLRVQEWPLSDQTLDTEDQVVPDVAAADVVASREALTTVNGDPTMRSLVPLAHRHDNRFLGELLKLYLAPSGKRVVLADGGDYPFDVRGNWEAWFANLQAEDEDGRPVARISYYSDRFLYALDEGGTLIPTGRALWFRACVDALIASGRFKPASGAALAEAEDYDQSEQDYLRTLGNAAS